MAAKEIPIAGYGLRLLSRVEVAEGTLAFHFEKPSQFDFKPGQSADLTLSNPPETDAEGNTRTFSIASSPFEPHLMFATRMRDTAFKRSLKKIPLDTEVKIDSLLQAKKALKRFPSIGDPGAEKILLLTRSYPVMALDSNGLRVLCRVGFAEEQKNYSATYRLAQDAIHGQLPRDYDSLIRAHQLLRQHGQQLCKRSKPRCTECPVRDGCNYSRKV